MAHIGTGGRLLAPEFTARVATSPGVHEPYRTLSEDMHSLTGARTAGLGANMIGTLGMRREGSNMEPGSLTNGNSSISHSLEAGREMREQKTHDRGGEHHRGRAGGWEA